MIKIVTNSPEETQALGRLMGECCRGAENFLLHGTLGAGKTCFLQGLARGLGVPDEMEVVSPTFVLHCQYEGRLLFNHIDAYRLDGARDIPDLGFEEDYSAPGCVNAIEWAEIMAENLPGECVEIEIEPQGENTREFSFSVKKTGDRIHESLLEKFSSLRENSYG